MRTIERDDTVHNEEYVLKSEALAEIAAEVAAERERCAKLCESEECYFLARMIRVA